MRWWRGWIVRVRALVDRAAFERELDEEIAFHLEQEARKLERQGWAPGEARREAHRRFGGVQRYRERTIDGWGVRWVDAVARDLRAAWRRLGRRPGFAVTVVSTLGIGIGATTAMFGVLYALLLSPLPYPHADRLVWVVERSAIRAVDMDLWRGGLDSAEEVEGFSLRVGPLTGHGAAREVVSMPTTRGYLTLLGARLESGRLWTPSEAREGKPVAVVGRHFWSELFGESAAEPRAFTLEGKSYDVIGVLDDEFENLGYDTDFWTPIADPTGLVNLIARLKPGRSVVDIQADLDAAVARAAPADAPGGDRARPRALSVREQVVGDQRTPVVLLFLAAAAVLLLACSNVASLLLARASTRVRETALRASLGASRATLVREALVECSVLAAVSAGAGLLLARAVLFGARRIAPASVLYGLDGADLVGPLLGFAILAAVLTTVIAGLGPALRAGRADPMRAPPGAVSGPRTQRWQDVLVGGEIALALALVVATSVLVRSYLVLRPASPGFAVEGRLVMPLTLPGMREARSADGPSPSTGSANTQRLERIVTVLEGSHPGLRVAALTDAPFSGLVTGARVLAVDGRPVDAPDGSLRVDRESVTADYAAVLGMSIVAGRPLADTDGANGPRVAVVSEQAAATLWPDDARPIGRRFTVSISGEPTEVTVVGIQADTRSSGRNTESSPEIYVPYTQFPWPRVDLVLWSPDGTAVGIASARDAVASVDPEVVVGEVVTLASLVRHAVDRPRYEAALMSAFGVVAALLAVLGCYGMLSYWVSLRTREIGVRKALGATSEAIARTVLARTLRVVGAGLAVGLLLTLAVTRVLASMAYGVSTTDPAWLATAAGALTTVALAAAWVPARRAAAVEPTISLTES